MEISTTKKISKITGPSAVQRDEDRITVRTNSDPIPRDLLIDILSRLPAKSLARFLCVSKHWASIIRSQDLANSFLTRSSTRSCSLFSVLDFQIDNANNANIELSLLSAPHARDSHDGVVHERPVANRCAVMSEYLRATMFNSVRGLLCLRSRGGYAIFNPCTRQFLRLPDTGHEGKKKSESNCLLGYDPVEDRYKVLVTLRTEDCSGEISDHSLVLTLGEDHEWRNINGGISPHHCNTLRGICINGVIYYKSWIEGHIILVRFDVRSEKFDLIRTRNSGESTLMNYKGNLAETTLVFSYKLDEYYDRISFNVLEDAEKQEWSEKVFVLPPSLSDLVRQTTLQFWVSATSAGEIVLAPNILDESYFVLLYNPERNSLDRVEVEGLSYCNNTNGDVRCIHRVDVFTFSDHVENFMFL